ncbi:MAG: endoribonuclease MazF [Chloroflexota bacterium]
MVTQFVPDRGDVVWLEFEPQVGHELARCRPALVLSPRAYSQRVGLALVCPVTSQIKGYPFEVSLTPTGGSPVVGVILADQVKSLDWRARQAAPLARVPASTVAEVVGLLDDCCTEPANQDRLSPPVSVAQV